MTGQKNFLLILASVIVIIFSNITSYLLLTQPSQPTTQSCTLEAKICPDGTAVGRTGPNCEFTECPVPSLNNSDVISDWKNYTSETQNIAFKYPANFRIWESYTPGQGFGNGIFIDYDQTEGAPDRWMRITNTEDKNAIFNSLEAEKLYEIPIGSTVFPKGDNQISVSVTRLSNIFIAGQEAHVYEDNHPNETPPPVRIILVKNKNTFYIFNITYSNYSPQTSASFSGHDIDYVKTFDQILSTFRFLDEDDETIAFSKILANPTNYSDKRICTTGYYFAAFEASAFISEFDEVKKAAPTDINWSTWVNNNSGEQILVADIPFKYSGAARKISACGTWETAGNYGHLGSYDYLFTIEEFTPLGKTVVMEN